MTRSFRQRSITMRLSDSQSGLEGRDREELRAKGQGLRAKREAQALRASTLGPSPFALSPLLLALCS